MGSGTEVRSQTRFVDILRPGNVSGGNVFCSKWGQNCTNWIKSVLKNFKSPFRGNPLKYGTAGCLVHFTVKPAVCRCIYTRANLCSSLKQPNYSDECKCINALWKRGRSKSSLHLLICGRGPAAMAQPTLGPTAPMYNCAHPSFWTVKSFLRNCQTIWLIWFDYSIIWLRYFMLYVVLSICAHHTMLVDPTKHI